MNDRDIFRQIMNHEQPPRLPKLGSYNIASTPAEHSIDFPKSGLDWYGVPWHVEADGSQTPQPGFRRLEDISCWKAENVVPKIDDVDWKAESEKATKNWDRENKIQVVMITSGQFERLYALVGFEDALMSFYDYPDEVEELLTAITDLKLQVIRKVKEYYNPDILRPHDDWGTNQNMFFSPAIWRRFIKPCVQRMIDECHAQGMLYCQHTCGYVTPILDDLVEMGVDLLEIQSNNDLVSFKQRYGNKVVLLGCFDAQIICRPGVDVEEARQSVRETLRVCGTGGGYAGYTYGNPAKEPTIKQMVEEEFEKFAVECYGYTGES